MINKTFPAFFGDINTISIPSDAVILFISLFIFGFLIFSFSNYVEKESKNILKTSNLQISSSQLDDQFDFEEKSLSDAMSLTSKLGKLDFFSNSKFFGLGALVFLGIGAASHLLLDNNQNLPQVLNTAHIEDYQNFRSVKSPFSFRQKQRSKHLTSQVKKISYLSPSLATIQRDDCKNVYKNEPVKFSF